MIYNVPMDIKVSNTNGASALNQVEDFLREAIREFGNQYGITNYELISALDVEEDSFE